jgi:hypothetical protein
VKHALAVALLGGYGGVSAADPRDGHESRFEFTEAFKGSDFYADLGSCGADHHAAPTATSFDLVGIFTVDPAAVVKTLQTMPAASQEWTEVPFPLSFIVSVRPRSTKSER